MQLSAIAIDAMLEFCQKSSTKVLAYYYIDFNDSSSMSVSKILRSIIKQICTGMPDIPKSVQSLCSQHRASGQEPSTSTLISILQALEQNLILQIYIINDALDEFSEQGKPELLQTIELLASQQFQRTHILVTSRTEDDIEKIIRKSATEDILVKKTLVDSDIGLFIQSSLSEDHRLSKLPQTIKDLIGEKLATGAQGM